MFISTSDNSVGFHAVTWYMDRDLGIQIPRIQICHPEQDTEKVFLLPYIVKDIDPYGDRFLDCIISRKPLMGADAHLKIIHGISKRPVKKGIEISSHRRGYNETNSILLEMSQSNISWQTLKDKHPLLIFRAPKDWDWNAKATL
jgi:hypothetical protein